MDGVSVRCKGEVEKLSAPLIEACRGFHFPPVRQVPNQSLVTDLLMAWSSSAFITKLREGKSGQRAGI